MKQSKLLYLSPEDWEKYTKAHTIYYKDSISNNKNPTERALFREAYGKEINKLKEVQVFDPDMEIQRNAVSLNKIIPINSIFATKRWVQRKARIVAREGK